MSWMIYGANGFTGRLLAALAVERGERPLLAGRHLERVRAVGGPLELASRAFDLKKPGEIDEALEGIDAVVHCAGPFSATSAPMVNACLRTCTHYLDITGEIEVLEAVLRRSAEARRARIVLLPGVGFDVVPTDCLAAALAAALPGAVELDLAFDGIAAPSAGTTKTALEVMASGGRVRREGRIARVPAAWKTRQVPFADGPRHCVTVPGGDVSTAYRSTGVPSIAVYAPMPPRAVRVLRAGRALLPLVGWRPVRVVLARLAAKMAGPDEHQRRTLRVQLWGEARRADGHSVSATLDVPEAYQLTVHAALESLLRVAAGRIEPGAWTPSQAFGAHFITELPGVNGPPALSRRSGSPDPA